VKERTLAGKVAIVTGAARGIGQAIAVELASRGASLAICDVAPCTETEAAIRAHGSSALCRACDVSDRSQVETFFTDVSAELGSPDILVNNAARTVRKPLIELETADLDKTWGTSLWGVFHCSQLAARQMIAAGRGGNIVNIGSVLAHIPYVNSSPYNGAKAAVAQMSNTWALELAPHGIRVNTIEPGWTDTPGERAFATEEQIREEGAKLPLGRLGSPQEIANAVAFLVSAEAAYITGTVLRVDGAVTLVK
jgi:glucose 1-dehydrogenase